MRDYCDIVNDRYEREMNEADDRNEAIIKAAREEIDNLTVNELLELLTLRIEYETKLAVNMAIADAKK